MEILLFIFFISLFVIVLIFRFYFYFTKDEPKSFPKKLKRRMSKNADGEEFLNKIAKQAGLFVIRNKAKGSYNDLNITFGYNYTGDENIYTLTINPHGQEKYNLGKVITGDDRLDLLVNIKTYMGNFRKVIAVCNNKIRNTLRKINKDFDILIFDYKIKIQSKDKTVFLGTEILNDLIDVSKKIIDNKNDDDLMLINIVLTDNNINVRRSCMNELVKYVDLDKHKKYIKTIMTDMKEKDPFISIMASTILEEEGIDSCIEIFKNTKKSEIIKEAINYLKKYIYLEKVKNIFQEALSFIDDLHLDSIIDIVCRIKNKKNIDVLLNFLNKNNYISVYSKITCMNFFEENEILTSKDWILSQIYNINTNVASSALNALKKIGDIGCVEKLNNFKKSEKNKVLKKLADETIKYIQKNIPDHLEGNLQITDHNEYGELSIHNEKGELSITENELE